MEHRKDGEWRKLDNAAKLFSAASNSKDTRVFRFFCELKEEVVEEKLQAALDKTLLKFPVFLSVMRKGLFWHYLEQSSQHAVVRKEYREPCSNLYVRDKKELLFEVTYYGRRINFEVFHALTDGTGASEFLKELVKNYLIEAHGVENFDKEVIEGDHLNLSEIEDDGFAKYYSKDTKLTRKKKVAAHQIRRYRSEMGSLQITEAEMSVADLKKRSKELGVSISAYLTTVFLCAIHDKMTKRQEEKPVVLMVPVNLRQFFPTHSMLNFFNWIEPGHLFGRGKDSFDEVAEEVKGCFKTQLTKEKMAQKMNEYFALEVNPFLRLAPLELKNICISAGTRTSAKDVTAVFSNMGIVDMGEALEPYIERFGVFTSTPKLELTMCSFKGRVYLGFTSRYNADPIKDSFFKILEDDGVKVTMLNQDYPQCTVKDSLPNKVFKFLSFVCIVVSVISLCVDYTLDQRFNYSLLICGAVFTMWFSLMIGFFKRHNLLKNAMWQLLLITIGCVLWDYFTGWRGWSINYVFPLASILILVFMLFLRNLYYRMPKEYMIYVVMAATYGTVMPLIFLATGLASVVIPSVISIGLSVILLAGLALFRGKEMQEEFTKKFHI